MRLFIRSRENRQKLNQAGLVRQVILIGIILIVAFGAVIAYRVMFVRVAASEPEIRSGIEGYCLDDYHNGTAANAPVDTWTCNGTAAQEWTVSRDTIRHGSNGCLDVQGNGKADGDSVVINYCDGSPGQAWTVDLGGFQNPNSGLCLAASASQAKTQLVAASCTNLTEVGEAWSAATWSTADNSNVSCAVGTKGQQVACYAERQWAAWQTGLPSHKVLLADYTDGNAYEQWCADFVSYVYREAGYPFENGERGGWDEYDANNVQNMGFSLHPASGYDPRPGDVAFFDYPGGHVEIVVNGGQHPTFVYGDSGTTDPATGNGEMNEDGLTSDGSAGQVVYYLSPN